MATRWSSICDYSDDLAREFHDINAEWISDMFRMEETDRFIVDPIHQMPGLNT